MQTSEHHGPLRQQCQEYRDGCLALSFVLHLTIYFAIL
jgi:hypothetical protein